ncbi:MAG: alpha/beta fold hydrolase [Methylobacteriaceae bacterium]|nr:alpha/beta fold hydrolase [Methylobacteriaceae bacterium]
MFVPGLLCTAELYRDQIAGLADLARITVADHGGAETIGAVAASVLAAAPARFALCGLSMGGYVAFEMLRQAPERIERLALLDTSAAADTPPQTAARHERIALAEAGRLAEVAAALWPNFVHASRVGDAALRARYDAMVAETGAARFVRQMRAIMSRPDSRPGLGEIAQQTLVLVGDADRVTPPAEAQVIADGIAFSRLTTIAACGHLSTMERPEAVTAALRQWLTAAA